MRLVETNMLYRCVLAILWVPIYAPASTVISEGQPAAAGGDSNTCSAPECEELVKMIERQMVAAEPCNDFHKYVCGKWKGDRELNSRHLKKKAVETLIGLLENAAEPSPEAENATNKLILAYKSCTQKGSGTEALKASIGKVVALYKLTKQEWPVVGGKSHWKKKNAYEDILRKTGPRPLFSYSVKRNGHFSTENQGPMILITKPTEFYVYDIEDYSVGEMSGSEGEATEPTYDYGSAAAKEEEAYKTFIIKSILLLKDSISKTRAESIAKDIIEMEKRLAKLSSEAKEAAEIKMNLSQLGQNLSDTFPIVKILQKDFEDLKDFNVTIQKKTEVLVTYIDYYKNALEFIKCSNMTTLVNYILWTKIRTMAKAQGTELHRIYLEYKRNTSIYNLTDIPSTFEENGISGTSNISLLCTRQLLENDVMLAAAASYYIREKFNKTSKDDVLKMLGFVMTRFQYFVANNTWMSSAMKEAAIKKMNLMKHIIGYPDWMLNDTIMNHLYRFVPSIEGSASFVEHYYFLLENEHKQTLLQLSPAAYFEKLNEDVPLQSHAYFEDATNSAVYPAAALVTHYKSPPIPSSVNYGAIGVGLAQLTSRMIDRYGETGKYEKDNWDNETAVTFCNRSSCLNHTEECNDLKVPPTHKHEKLHDYLGVRIAYEAMKNSRKDYKPPFTLPDEKKAFDTEEKVFFIFFGNLYCPISINEAPVQSRADVEEEFSKSLNEIVYNYVEFNKTFGCQPLGEDVCDLMPPAPKSPPSC